VNERIDETLGRLKTEPLDPRLSGLEPAVWARIGGEREARDGGMLFLPMRAAVVAAALASGVLVGAFGAGEARARQQEIAVFSVETRLAPSTLLDGL